MIKKLAQRYEKQPVLRGLIQLIPLGIDAILVRLTRTRCYKIFVGYAFGPAGSMGKLTPTYFRLKKFIEGEDGGA